MIRALRGRREPAESGFTLVELLVSMMLFAVVLAMVTSGMIVMQKGLRKAQGQTDNLDASRAVIELLDRQVRYANTITQPGAGTSGDTYVEWRTGDTGQPQTCTQWRFDPTAQTLSYRSWAATSPPGTPTAWATKATNVVQSGSAPLFTTTALPVGQAQAAANNSIHASLTVVFAIRHGVNPSTTSKSQVTLTAINTKNAVPSTGGLETAQAVCNLVGRP